MTKITTIRIDDESKVEVDARSLALTMFRPRKWSEQPSIATSRSANLIRSFRLASANSWRRTAKS